MSMTKKVILIGHFGVGKSSLVRQFVHQQFSEDYITTIGVKIDKKEIDVAGTPMKLLIWDIAGEDTQQKVPQSYRLGAHGALYVLDVTRPSTYNQLNQELKILAELIPNIPVMVLANKQDLVDPGQLRDIMSSLPVNALPTSAKSGSNVEQAFQNLAAQLL